MGYLLALIPALGWGLQSIVMQKIRGKFTNKVMGMVMTTFVFAIIISFFKHPTVVTSNLIIGSTLCGISWIIGQLLQVKSFDLVGVSMAMPISTGEQLLGTTLIGALYFHEWQSAWQFIFGIGALVLIISGIYLTTYSDQRKKQNVNLRSGLIVLTISALGLIGYAVIPRVFHLNSWDILLPQSIAMLVTMFIVAGFQKDRKILGVKTWQNMTTGIFFAIANVAILFSNEINGIAVGYTLSQLNVIVATLGGLLILHEHKSAKELRFTLVRLLLIVTGAILIGVTKN